MALRRANIKPPLEVVVNNLEIINYDECRDTCNRVSLFLYKGIPNRDAF
jgi:hypothetical protein